MDIHFSKNSLFLKENNGTASLNINYTELAARLEKIEKRLQQHDENIVSLASTLNQLMLPPKENSKGKIGFLLESEGH